jgi:hypothetical protein
MSAPLWSRHSLAFWESIAAEPCHAYYVRVAALAYGRHGPNGHAPQAWGALSLALSKDGVRYRHAGRAIEDAIKVGMLDPSSTTRCLVVPPNGIVQGDWNHWPNCPVHGVVKRPSAPLVDAIGRRVRHPVEQSAPSSGALTAQPLLTSYLPTDATELETDVAS